MGLLRDTAYCPVCGDVIFEGDDTTREPETGELMHLNCYEDNDEEQ